MSERKSIGKKLRFEVFKRDRFSCQYCGKCAPEVVLHIDHVNPVSKGGDNDILNLITSCADCNLGKGARELSDDSELSKQRAQLEELSERREQLEAMIKWRDGLRGIEEDTLNEICRIWDEAIWPCEVNDNGRATLKRHLKKFGFAVLSEAIQKAEEQYLCVPEVDPKIANYAFGKLGGICYFTANPNKNDDHDIYYVRGILRNRLNYLNDKVFFSILRQAKSLNVDMESVKDLAKSVSNWSDFRDAVDSYIENAEPFQK